MMQRIWETEKAVAERLLKDSSISTLTERSLYGSIRGSFRFYAAGQKDANRVD